MLNNNKNFQHSLELHLRCTIHLLEFAGTSEWKEVFVGLEKNIHHQIEFELAGISALTQAHNGKNLSMVCHKYTSKVCTFFIKWKWNLNLTVVPS